MRFCLTLPEDGRRICGDIRIPSALPAGSPARAAAIASLEASMRRGDARQAQAARGRVAGLIPGLAAQLQPELPAAAAARKVVQTDDNGPVITTTTNLRPAVPAPSIRALAIAQQLALYVAGEQLLAREAARLALAAGLGQAMATRARELDARLARLEREPGQ